MARVHAGPEAWNPDAAGAMRGDLCSTKLNSGLWQIFDLETAQSWSELHHLLLQAMAREGLGAAVTHARGIAKQLPRDWRYEASASKQEANAAVAAATAAEQTWRAARSFAAC